MLPAKGALEKEEPKAPQESFSQCTTSIASSTIIVANGNNLSGLSYGLAEKGVKEQSDHPSHTLVARSKDSLLPPTIQFYGDNYDLLVGWLKANYLLLLRSLLPNRAKRQPPNSRVPRAAHACSPGPQNTSRTGTGHVIPFLSNCRAVARKAKPKHLMASSSLLVARPRLLLE